MEADKQKEKSKIAEMEEGVLALWEKEKTFEKVLKARKGKKPFVFYEGPPTANGMPHPGHVLGRSFKDLFLRYKTMQGFYVERHAGWDTHGLPVEIEMEKKLGMKSKADIETFGVAEFNRLCRESVWQYKDEWEKMTRRIGFWLDIQHPYITYENKYIETLWWVIARIFEKGLLVEDYKVTPYCVRCGTGLSSHELAQEYVTVKDPSVYVKFRVKPKAREQIVEEKTQTKKVFDHGGAEGEEYFLVWTTTPWTLLANVALVVNPNLAYIKARKDGETFILAEARAGILGDGWEIVQKLTGKELVGLEYQQIFPFLKPDKKAFFVVSGDFVSATDGSGIVHCAPAYGEDDMRMAKEHGLPTLHPVQENGEFSKEIPWQGKFVKNTDKDIIAALAERELLFREEAYEHEYPFCWRCHTPILYFARKGWFIKMSQMKDELIARNKTINWVPAHIKEGRFGEWLKDVKDWAFSRDRYWGTPLPIWKCQVCKNTEVVGSIQELGRRSVSRNRYIIMRHGEALFNVKNSCDSSGNQKNHLTKKGEEQVKKSLAKFTKGNPSVRIDIIMSSPLIRAQETAELAGKVFGVAKSATHTDPLLREIAGGIFDGKKVSDYHGYFMSLEEKFTKVPPGGENLHDLKKRLAQFIRETDSRYEGKTILVVSHEYPIWILESMLAGFDDKKTVEAKKKKGSDYIKTGEVRFLPSVKLPLDDEGNLDMHKPYIDGIALSCRTCKGEMRRIPEVADVWFDSGAMPFAQAYFPFAQSKSGSEAYQKLAKKIDFPADFICEGIDQTRGWFYTLLAVSSLLGFESPYKNVISLGHILDKHGKKMSKSKKNYMDPMEVADIYGVDALRWYFFVVNPAGEPKRFDEKDLLVEQRKSVMALLNMYNFYDSYAPKKRVRKTTSLPPRSRHALDRWIVSRCAETARDVTAFLDVYDAQGASRALAGYMDDVSNWYIRRSRERFQHPENPADYRKAVATLSYVLETLLAMLAPFMPFVTEYLWRRLGRKGSVHAAMYPKFRVNDFDEKLNHAMMKARDVVSEALKQRMASGVKVRQPLAKVRIRGAELKNNKELHSLIADEVNVKEVVWDGGLTSDVVLDTVVTPELKEEGMVRDLIRNIQQVRKELGLKKNNSIAIVYASETLSGLFQKHKEKIRARTGARSLGETARDAMKNPREISFEEGVVWFDVII